MTGYQNDSENFFCNGVFHLSRWFFFSKFSRILIWRLKWVVFIERKILFKHLYLSFFDIQSKWNRLKIFWDFEFFELIDSSILLDEITRKYTNKGESNTRNFRIRSYCTSSSLFRSIILRQGWSDEEGWSIKWSLGKSFRMMQYS